MPVVITLAAMKGKGFLSISDTKQDYEIQQYIYAVIESAIDYLDNEDITNAATLPTALNFPLMKQINFEYRRKADPGLSSVSYPDGSVAKFVVDEWLPSVKKVLDRHTTFYVGEGD